MSFFQIDQKIAYIHFFFAGSVHNFILKHLIVESDLYSSWDISLLEFTSISLLSFDPITESLIDCLEQRAWNNWGWNIRKFQPQIQCECRTDMVIALLQSIFKRLVWQKLPLQQCFLEENQGELLLLGKCLVGMEQ